MSGDYQLRYDIDRFNTLFSNFENTVKEKLGLDDLVTLADVLDNYQTKYDADRERSELIDLIYPVGAIFVSTNSVNPSTLFGGEWEQIDGRFLLASSETHTLGDTGGSEEVTLTANQSGIRSHGHGMAHTHSHSHVSSAYQTGQTARGTSHSIPVGRTNPDKTGNFTSDTDSTASSKSVTDNNTAQDATEAHTNMPPYLVVNVWERTE